MRDIIVNDPYNGNKVDRSIYPLWKISGLQTIYILFVLGWLLSHRDKFGGADAGVGGTIK